MRLLPRARNWKRIDSGGRARPTRSSRPSAASPTGVLSCDRRHADHRNLREGRHPRGGDHRRALARGPGVLLAPSPEPRVPSYEPPEMHPLDWAVVIVYITWIVYDGLRRSKGTDKVDGYFLANRSLPWWAVGLSVMATQMSAVTIV